MLVRIANREDPDQTACLDLFGRQLVLEILKHLLYLLNGVGVLFKLFKMGQFLRCVVRFNYGCLRKHRE